MTIQMMPVSFSCPGNPEHRIFLVRTADGDPFRFCGTCDTRPLKDRQGWTALHGPPALVHYMAIYDVERAA